MEQQQGLGPGRKKTQTSLLQMTGFKRNIQDMETVHTPFVDAATTMAAHSQELNAEHERIKQARKLFKESWLEDHDWLEFNYDNGRAYCTYCKEDRKCRSAYGKEGSTNIRTSAFREHAESDQHKHASYVATSGKNALHKVEKKKKESVDRELVNLFKCAYFIGKESLTYRKFVPIVHLLRGCGMVAPLLYNDDKACSDFLNCISKSLEEKLLEKIRLSPWFGIMVDESTDISVTQNLILYATYLDDFQPKKAFLGMLSLPQADAKTIVTAIHDKLNKSSLDLLKIVAFGSDGAAVMIGCRTGVATRLKELHPYMTSIHCVAHRTNLCVASIAKHLSCKLICEKIDKLINGAATYFSNSSLRGRYLKELQEELAYSTLRLENISTTRWLSRHNAVQKLCEVFEPVMLVFKDNSVNIYQELREFKVVYILHFLADILKHLSILSLDFQKDWVDVTAIGSLVKTTKKYIELEFLDEVSILDLNGYLKDSKGYPVIPDFGTPKGYLAALRGAIKGNMYRSVELVRDIEGNDLLDAIEFQKVFSKCVLDALDERFAEQEILSCFKILSPAYIPRAARELKEFGLEELNQLLKFYGEPRVVDGIKFDSLISEDKIRMEFRKFKIQASTEWQGKNLLDTWSIILSQKMLREDKYAELAKLATIAMVQCSSTAICERGFSHMNHIKDKYRNRLQTTGLDALLRVAVEGPPVETIEEFDFDDSIRNWKAGKKYRHIFSGCSSTSGAETNANIGSETDIEEME